MEQLRELLGTALYEEVVSALQGKGKGGKDLELAIANDGSFLPKAKFDTVYQEFLALKEDVEAKEQQIADLTEQLQGQGTLQGTIDELAERLAAQETAHQETLRRQDFDRALERAMREVSARNDQAVIALLNLEELRLEDGRLLGLTEQLAALREDAPYLFAEEEEPSPYSPRGGRRLPDYEQMSDSEYYRYMIKKG